jgi:predicted lipoprotein with Yx(FWY)xxD motif
MKQRLLIAAVAAVAALAAGIEIAMAASGGLSGAARSGAATVTVKQIAGHGKVLVDAKGRALYRSDQEKHGIALCVGACLSFWQPLTVSGTPTKGGSLAGKLATAKRPDGGRQVTYDGRLLYRFTLDKPGEVSGEGFKDAFGGRKFTWHVARPLGAASSPAPAGTTTPTYTYRYASRWPAEPRRGRRGASPEACSGVSVSPVFSPVSTVRRREASCEELFGAATPPSATRTSSTAYCFRVSATWRPSR